VVGAGASTALQYHAAAHGANAPWPPPNSLGLNGNPVQDASGDLSVWPNPAAHPEGATGFHEARRGGRDHWRSAVPMMRQHSWAPMGYEQGHTGTAGNMVLSELTASCRSLTRASPVFLYSSIAAGRERRLILIQNEKPVANGLL